MLFSCRVHCALHFHVNSSFVHAGASSASVLPMKMFMFMFTTIINRGWSSEVSCELNVYTSCRGVVWLNAI